MISAAIDIGTNSARLLTAEVIEGKILRLVNNDLRTTRLGEGIAGRCLNEAAMTRTIEAIKEFVHAARQAGAEWIVPAATSAVRDAVNQAVFLQRVQAQTGLKVKVLTGEQEALLSYRGVVAGLPIETDKTMVLDIGGGSTELIWPEPVGLQLISLALGAVRATEGRYDDEKIKTIIYPALGRINQVGPTRLAGVGGTVTTVTAMALGLSRYDREKVHGFTLTLSRIEQILHRIQQTPLAERQNLPGLQPARADIIEAGVRILQLLLQGTGLSAITVSETDILYGLLLWENKCRNKN